MFRLANLSCRLNLRPFSPRVQQMTLSTLQNESPTVTELSVTRYHNDPYFLMASLPSNWINNRQSSWAVNLPFLKFGKRMRAVLY